MKITQPADTLAPNAFERGVFTLIRDSIALAIAADISVISEEENTLARASVVSSALYLEACANCCLDLLDLGDRFASEVDRLPTIAKYDLFLHIKHRGRKIDRSRTEYQGYSELKALRDAFVHPKAQKYVWLEWSETGSISTTPKSKSLGLAKIPAYCCVDDAIVALRAAHNFANYFFRECAKLGPQKVSALLHSEAEIPNLKDHVTSFLPHTYRLWLGRKNINLSYMRLGWHDA